MLKINFKQIIMKKANRFWVVLPAVVMLFTSAVQASETFTTNSTFVNQTKPSTAQLNQAISKGDLVKVQELVDLKVDINKDDERGKTPIMYAILYNQPQIVSYLIGKGADYRASDSNGVSVLEYAEKSNSEVILKLITDARKRR